MEMNVNKQMQKLTAGLPLGKAPPVPSSVPRRGYFISEVWPFIQPKESPIQTAFKNPNFFSSPDFGRLLSPNFSVQHDYRSHFQALGKRRDYIKSCRD